MTTTESPADTRGIVAYIASQELIRVSSLLPSNRNRSLVVHSLVNSLGLLNERSFPERKIQIVKPQCATQRALSAYHSKDYLKFVLNSKESTENAVSTASEYGLEDDCPLFPGVSSYIQLVGGATLTAAEALKTGFAEVAICWDGGRHHARKSKASGFCYVADCTLAILSLKKPTPSIPRPKVMYLDLDLHFSDGVSEAFYLPQSSNSQILTFSIHHAAPGFFPASPQAELPDTASDDFDPFTLSIPLKQGASNGTYERIWPTIQHVKDIFQPDYIIVQCGVDGLAGDPYATFNWSMDVNVPGSMGWYVNQIVNEWPGRKLLLGGGGYNSPNAARAWAYLTSIALKRPLDLDTEIPDHSGFPLYAPSFTLDVTAGNMQDTNTEDYLNTVVETYQHVISSLERRMK